MYKFKGNVSLYDILFTTNLDENMYIFLRAKEDKAVIARDDKDLGVIVLRFINTNLYVRILRRAFKRIFEEEYGGWE